MEACSGALKRNIEQESVELPNKEGTVTALFMDTLAQQRRAIPSNNIQTSRLSSTLSSHKSGVEGAKKNQGKKEVVFSIGGQRISCDREALYGNEYFLVLLTGGMKESGSEEITIEGVGYDTFSHILKAITTHELPEELDLEEWVDLAYAANQFQAYTLLDVCEKELTRHVSKVVEQLAQFKAQNPYRYGFSPSSLSCNTLKFMELEEKLLNIWNIAEILDRRELVQACCKPEVPLPKNNSFHYQQPQPLQEGAFLERTEQSTCCYHFSYLALGIAVEQGYAYILPSLASLTDQHKQSPDRLNGYPEIGLCFHSSYIDSTRRLYSVRDRATLPVEEAIKNGYTEVIRWLATDKITLHLFTFSHLQLAISKNELAISKWILLALTNRFISIRRLPSALKGTVETLKQQGHDVTYTPEKWRNVVDDLLVSGYAAQNKEAFKNFVEGGKACFSPTTPPSLFFTFAQKGDVAGMTTLYELIEVSSSAVDAEGNSALHHAVAHDRLEMAEWLVSKDFNCEVKNRKLETPLHLAVASKSSTLLLPILFKGKCDFDAADRGGHSALSNAIQKQKKKAALLLLKHGANLMSPNEQKCSTFSPQLLRAALDKLLTTCYADKDYGAIAIFLKAGVSLFPSNQPSDLFFSFASLGNIKEIEHLWKSIKIDIASLNKEGKSALHLATQAKKEEMMHWLISHGAPIDLKDSSQETPLHMVASSNQKEGSLFLKILLEGKGNLDVGNGKGNTPLHLACQKSNQSACLALLKKEATLVPPSNKFGEQPLDFPAKQGRKSFIQSLFTAIVASKLQNPINEALLWAGLRQGAGPQDAYYDLVAYLIDNGASVSITNKNKETLLHKTAQYGLNAPTTFLLKHQANVNSKDNEGQTPLHKAAFGGYPEVVRQLLEKEALIETWDNKGRTPAQLAHEQRANHLDRYSDYAEVIRMLEEKGCIVQ